MGGGGGGYIYGFPGCVGGGVIVFTLFKDGGDVIQNLDNESKSQPGPSVKRK